MKRIILIAVALLALAAASSAQASTGRCRPPVGPGDSVIHFGYFHVANASCAVARRTAITCAPLSFGRSGSCTAAFRYWRCTSRAVGQVGSTERCVSGRQVVSWLWID